MEAKRPPVLLPATFVLFGSPQWTLFATFSRGQQWKCSVSSKTVEIVLATPTGSVSSGLMRAQCEQLAECLGVRLQIVRHGQRFWKTVQDKRTSEIKI